jgi:Protein of unknown function (DUF1549)/Protein of unknown function (DUF1553)
MNQDRDDSVLDACLEEILGGRTPPDLTARILEAIAARDGNRATPAGDEVLLPPHPAEISNPEPPPILSGAHRALQLAEGDGQGVVHINLSGPVRIRKRRTTQHVVAIVVAASLVGLLISAVLLVRPRTEVAKAPAADKSTANTAVASVTPKIPDLKPAPEIVSPRSAELPTGNAVEGPQLAIRPAPLPQDTQLASNAPQDKVSPTDSPAPSAPEMRSLRPSPDGEIVSFVNAELTRTWRAAGVKPSQPATEAEWCRRLFVRVLGRIPHPDDELKPFEKDRSADKRQRLVNRLLTDDKYAEEFARHWSAVWTNVLIGHTGGRGNSPASREGLEQYLRTALLVNKPYNELVRELLTATGSPKVDAADYNPAVNFLIDGSDKDATLATARVARVFLGQQLQCAQCHTHPTQDWSQDQFWAFNSFFRQMQVDRRGGVPRLVNADFPGQGLDSNGGEVFFETPTGLLKTAFPRFIDGTEVPRSGELAQVDRRAELARLVTQSELLPKAAVNRVWSHFFGYGFTRSVDDMGPNSSPSQPQVLDRLAREFAAHNYDLKSLIRWSVLSDPFGRSSKTTDLVSKDMPEDGEVALFSRYYSRQMQAEEVYNSLVQAAQIRKTAAGEKELQQARVDWLSQFARKMGTDDAQEESHFNGGVRQSLNMMNGDLMRRAVSSQQDGILKTVAASKLNFSQKIEHLFLSALSRQPTPGESQVASRILANSKGNETIALEDVWWAILNSNEFILDH